MKGILKPLALAALLIAGEASFIPRQPGAGKKLWNSKRHKTDTFPYFVDGNKVPLVDFDVGDSYAGLMPIRDSFKIDAGKNETREFFFWYFPSKNPAAANEITIWLNGGPGCSSALGMLLENGPFLWQPGLTKPFENYWSWTNLTNMVFIEQPVGTGLSVGTPSLLTSESDVAKEFLGFWLNFVETFGLENRDVYITGESYAGYYIPYIADAMLNMNDTKNFNLQGSLIYDPAIGQSGLQFGVPLPKYVNTWQGIFNLNKTTRAELAEIDQKCGYSDFIDEWLVFPSKGVMPTAPQGENFTDPECDVYAKIFIAWNYVNPCPNVYHITDYCPFLNDPVSYPADGVKYFNRSDVQRTVHVPPTNWELCSSKPTFRDYNDTSRPAVFTVLPGVIERSKRTIIANGQLDFLIPTDGTLMALHNMTWGGATGFQNPPSETFFVPYSDWATYGINTAEIPYGSPGSYRTFAGVGDMGEMVTERGLTFVTVNLAGHMVPQYQPAAAFRNLEFLLGRVDSMGVGAPGFTTGG